MPPEQKIDPKKIKCALGFDPGRYNFGWAIYDRNRGLRFSGVIEGVENVKFIPTYRKQLLQLMRLHQPDVVCVERYHSQPGRGSKTNMELINLAIGILIEYCTRKKIPWVLVTASTHKRWLATNYEVGLVVDKRKARKGRYIKKKYDITTYSEWKELPTEHEVDAANQAKYVLERVFAVEPKIRRVKP